MTISSMEVWSTIFEVMFGSVSGNKRAFKNRLERLIMDSGLDNSNVSNLLITVANEL